MTLDNYPGAKSQSGIISWLINNIPDHDVYYELCAGSAQLFREKKPAHFHNVINDLNPSVYELLKSEFKDRNVSIGNRTMFSFLKGLPTNRRQFMYIDPPYPASARRSSRPLYEFEMLEDSDHVKLLLSIRDLNANVMISTRQNDLYDTYLKEWRKETFNTVDRGGACVEVIYMNYSVPEILHQYNHLGADFTDRQRINRKIARFQAKISALPPYEKHLFIQSIIKEDTPAVEHFLSMQACELT